MSYRDQNPQYYKELTSDGIIAFFEDERATKEEVEWFKEILINEEFRLHRNPISKWNWGKIKTEFAKKFFPDIAPLTTQSALTTEERINRLLGI